MSGHSLHKGRLYHRVPDWVADGATFHIRIRCDPANPTPLTEPRLAKALLESVEEYQQRQRWWARLFLLMADHCHALIALPHAEKMSSVIGDWKRWHRSHSGVLWQENYFDHRLRNDRELELKSAYIRRNPVASGLCVQPEDWPWIWPETPSVSISFGSTQKMAPDPNQVGRLAADFSQGSNRLG